MKPIIKHTILILALVGVYFAADFLEKGIVLNNLTPYPIIGIVFWLLLIYVVYVVIVQPIIQFKKLKTQEDINITKQAAKIMSSLDKFKNEDRKTNWKSETWAQLHNLLQKEIDKNSPKFKEREKELLPIVCNFIEQDNIECQKSEKAKKIIKNYSWSAALCVVFSRNSFLDGMLMLFAQLNMTVELAKLYGYKPSPLFNSLCFGWIATNSIITGLFAQAGADAVGDIFVDSLTDGELVEGSLTNTVLSKTSSMAIEALASATTVYLTGQIVLLKLQGKPLIELKSLFKMRREGRLEMLKEIPASVSQKLSPAMKDFFGNLKNIFTRQEKELESKVLG